VLKPVVCEKYADKLAVKTMLLLSLMVSNVQVIYSVFVLHLLQYVCAIVCRMREPLCHYAIL